MRNTSRRPDRNFNPRSRVGSDDIPALSPRMYVEFQSTLPRGERRFGASIKRAFTEISIHAPAWGATPPHLVDVAKDNISIHAPAWGATLIGLFGRHNNGISIHAPAWGATDRELIELSILIISIHAPAWGATAKMHKFYAFLDKITIFRELNGDFAWF